MNDVEELQAGPVPDHYRGVWVRTLLEPPHQRDDSTFVRWLQTSHWHADLRVPATPECQTRPLAMQQGFCGITAVHQQAEGEVCTWHRVSDFQPPRGEADAGTMVFETPDRVIERGLHATYLEVWERLPRSMGRSIVLAGMDVQGADNQSRVLVAGRYLMHVRPRSAGWPVADVTGVDLASVLEQHPSAAAGLLDFEISFGVLEDGCWTVERSTLPALEGGSNACSLQRISHAQALVDGGSLAGVWSVVEWSCDTDRV